MNLNGDFKNIYGENSLPGKTRDTHLLSGMCNLKRSCSSGDDQFTCSGVDSEIIDSDTLTIVPTLYVAAGPIVW